jgi:hypothetical protein
MLLQMKFYMFTREREFLVFRQLFCTSNTLEQAQASRTLVFILLQLSLALSIMKDDPQGWSNEWQSKLGLSSSLAATMATPW